MKLSFSGELVSWRGPAPYVFVPIPEEASRNLAKLAGGLSYGWGVIPVQAKIGKTEWMTSIMPRDGLYLVPIKLAVQRQERIAVGDMVEISLLFG
jgi:hypothetical protein